MIERISKARGSISNQSKLAYTENPESTLSLGVDDFDKYSASHIRLFCRDFTYYLFEFCNDSLCSTVYQKISYLVNRPKLSGSIKEFYAFEYLPNALELEAINSDWISYDPEREYTRQKLLAQDSVSSFWRLSKINDKYRFCPSYPEMFVVPSSISDSVIQHAGKFRSKQRVPAVVYKHNKSENGNVIARCLQPLVGLNLQNRSLQDEKLIEEIFRSQALERELSICNSSDSKDQPQKNLIVDLRPITNAMAQHALGAGTEIVDNYRGRLFVEKTTTKPLTSDFNGAQNVEKIFCNIDNIHVMRDSLDKLTQILSDLDKKPISGIDDRSPASPSLQQSLTKTQWLHHLFLILQAVDRIIKSVHLNNTNVLIHCSDGWDRTSQASALAQLCLDPYFRTYEGFMVLIEKEWLSFGFKFATRSDQGGCIGSRLPKSTKDFKGPKPPASSSQNGDKSENTPTLEGLSAINDTDGYVSLDTPATKFISSIFQRAASHIKSSASGTNTGMGTENRVKKCLSIYGGSNERSPVFHQFLDCVYQIFRQQPSMFEFNSRFLKRLLYHSYSCQYGTFLCDSEKDKKNNEDLDAQTTSVWAYFLSRRKEFTNHLYIKSKNTDVIFFNFSEVKWWCELYGRSEEEMNGLSNSLEKKFAELKMKKNGGENSPEYTSEETNTRSASLGHP
ncbi:phosphatases II [Metschnikowia bicuspidata var. bicuspidata NRRL YB-4993]|uniref:Phosphatases II n=1 Tax=Metschnikowia bicuspidata var. bicuspidata NRRL YB-4993 TaxID=869754 RepID=A0A1A0HIS7_9ASCO|nr:phosphatases II [Metschnikowia bicuspidata var. bicuspidata NRRL YB-4993]OBA23915.1 phosphatases II [Metschnikowia bicuspidata var. bicuspidata NRRL YB-4993]